jgi:hypothetical protein
VSLVFPASDKLSQGDTFPYFPCTTVLWCLSCLLVWQQLNIRRCACLNDMNSLHHSCHNVVLFCPKIFWSYYI